MITADHLSAGDPAGTWPGQVTDQTEKTSGLPAGTVNRTVEATGAWNP
ncbi:hypothetical protein [Actinoplanes philippinensis]